MANKGPKIKEHTLFQVYAPNEHLWEECVSKLDDDVTDVTRDIVAAFHVFDRNKDGYLCARDVENLLVNIGVNLSADELKQFLAIGDRDKDGLINCQDFIDMMMKSPHSPLKSNLS